MIHDLHGVPITQSVKSALIAIPLAPFTLCCLPTPFLLVTTTLLCVSVRFSFTAHTEVKSYGS